MSTVELNEAPPVIEDPVALASALGSGDPMALLMSQLGAANPQAAMLMRVMEERNRARDAERAQEEQEEASLAAAERERDFHELKETVERACADLDALRTRMGDLADALGACPQCFGSDVLCQECRGRGRPGGRAPDPAAFRTYVLPAIRRARAVEAERRTHFQQHPSQQPATSSQTSSQPGIQP